LLERTRKGEKILTKHFDNLFIVPIGRIIVISVYRKINSKPRGGKIAVIESPSRKKWQKMAIRMFRHGTNI